MFITPAYAQATGGPGGLEAFIPLILIFVVFYFFLIRPQQKKMKQHKEMVNQVRRGDRVVTAGGILGLVTKVDNEQEVTIEIAENVAVKVLKATLTDVISKTNPVTVEAETSTSKVPQQTPKETLAKKPATKTATKTKETTRKTTKKS